jgi:uncharacterized protein YodC (DUF2158 family)
MANEFKPGEIVQLKSGGPNMTVDYVNDVLQTITCSWFIKNKRQTDSFPPASLKPAPEKK